MFGTDNYNICDKMLLRENVIGFFFLIIYLGKRLVNNGSFSFLWIGEMIWRLLKRRSVNSYHMTATQD